VKFVINTHYHYDHVAGNGIFVDAGAVVLGQRNVRDWIHSETLRTMTIAAAAGSDIRPEEIALVQAFARPTVVYDDAVDLYLGSRLQTGAWVVAGGIVLGVLASLAVGRLLQNNVVRTDARDPVTVVMAVAVLVIAALAASVVPARRATLVEPTTALRIE
jgi:predicted lysophospholipase L1 biosynthesis ABC-type transport system permease subunit